MSTREEFEKWFAGADQEVYRGYSKLRMLLAWQACAQSLSSYLLSRMEELNSAWDLNDYKDRGPKNVEEAAVAYSELKRLEGLLK